MSEVTTVRVSRSTLKMLERLRDKLKAGSFDEAIRLLVMRQRKMILDEVFGLDRDRITPFTEEDRGEDRS
ncbi:MAG: VapB-type antitoxin [Candidatus Bathyarchaeia archaeon]